MKIEPIAKPTGLPLKEHNRNLLRQAAELLSKRAFVIEKYKRLTNGGDFQVELETSAKWHDIGKTDDAWQTPCQKDFAIWQTLSAIEKRDFRAPNLMKAGIRHEMASLQIALENKHQLSQAVTAAIAAHHGKLSRRHEHRWKDREQFEQFWNGFNNQSAELPSYDKQTLDKIVLKRYRHDGIRSCLQLIDHRASAAENGDELPEFKVFDYKFPHGEKRGVQLEIEKLWDEPFAILRAPTGAGKTDAALLWAKRQVDKGRADRLVIAMPTRFTSNALSIAVTEENFKNIGDAGLYHSSALYQRLKDRQFKSKREEWETKRFIDKEQDLARILETPLTVTTIDHLCICLTGTRESHHATFFGLANSCVVIDEADFYDDFTQLNIVVLLRVLRRLEVPVLLMSATVPDSATELYRQSGFAVSKIYADESDAKRIRCNITRHGDAKTPEDVAELLERALRGEPTIIYANTVARAQAYYDWFKTKLEDWNADYKLTFENTILYHSRFIEPDKVEKENRLREMLGRQAWEKGTRHGVAILTQIGEISVNISADLMISDLCPLDRLAQRVGRLARFARRKGKIENVVGELYVVNPVVEKNGEPRIYPAPYGEYSKSAGWKMSEAFEKSGELLFDGEYSAEKFVELVNLLYPSMKESASDALVNKKQLECLIVANWLILPRETNEEETAEDSDQTKDWRSRDIPFQYTVFTGFDPSFDFDDDRSAYRPPTNKAELREFEARFGVTLYAYEYHRVKKAGMIDCVENNKSLVFDIKGEKVTREYVQSRYYSKDTGLKFSLDAFGAED